MLLGAACLLAVSGCGGWWSRIEKLWPAKVESSDEQWAGVFQPAEIHISFFTQSRDFDDKKGDDGIEIRVQPLDQFGDPTKAVGNWRFEVFKYRERSLERRSERLCHWYVQMTTPEQSQRYYDSIDRSYRFPLLWDTPIAPKTRVLIQATFYPPGGHEKKLIAEYVIRIGR